MISGIATAIIVEFSGASIVLSVTMIMTIGSAGERRPAAVEPPSGRALDSQLTTHNLF